MGIHPVLVKYKICLDMDKVEADELIEYYDSREESKTNLAGTDESNNKRIQQ